MKVDDHLEDAKSAKSRSDFARASDIYLQHSVNELIENDYDPLRDGGATIGWLLRALSAAAISKDPSRESIIGDLLETSINQSFDKQQEDAIAGVCMEWLGDASILRGTPAAVTYYKDAEEFFAKDDERSAVRWSMEKGRDYADTALFEYLESIDVDFDGKRFSATDYGTRLQYKRGLARSIGET